MAMLTTPLLVTAALVVCIIIIRRVRSPLTSLPGPTLGRLTSWQLKYYELRGKRTEYVHKLHRKYGNAVQIAPNEAVFSSLEAMKEIYLSKGSGYDKSHFYHLFSEFGLR